MSEKNQEGRLFEDQLGQPWLTVRDALQHLVRDVEIGELLERIRKFRRLDFKRLSREQIAGELKALLKFGSVEDKFRPISFCMSQIIDPGMLFYRVRNISQNRTSIPLIDMKNEADAWEPPADRVGPQRLNQAGESVLYTSETPAVALEESKVSNWNIVPLIVYESVEPLHITGIGLPPGHHGLDPSEQVKLEMMTDFLRDEFTRDVGNGTEYLYKISDVLAKEYFTIPEEIHDGWQYPSIARKGGWNYCFKPERARAKLALRGFIVAGVTLVNDQFGVVPLCVAQGFDKDGRFCYHPSKSPVGDSLMRSSYKALSSDAPKS